VRVQRFLEQFARWTSSQSDIDAAALIGSHARNEATATSDVDVLIITRAPERFLHNTTWAQRFGTIVRQQVEPYGRVTSLRVWYSDGCEVEYAITDETWSALPPDEGTTQVVSDGMRVLFERTPMLSNLRSRVGRR
jgi:predicted nucleotidyltransferase